MAWSIDSILQDPMLERVGWALLHSVWQGAAIAVVLAASLHWTRRSQPRYLLACSALILSLLAPAATVWITAETDRQPSEVRHFTTAADASPVNFDRLSDGRIPRTLTTGIPTPFPASSDLSLQAQSLARSALPYAAILWALGVIILCIRHVGGLFAVRSLRRDSIPTSDPSTIAMMTRLLDRLTIRQAVTLRECARTSIPCVIGVCRPMILLPVGMIANLSPQFLESILAHELAHIRRHDYLVNLLQVAIETLLFYHPAVWWISQQIRQEREHCCDDLAVEMVGDATAYSEALTAVEEIRIDPLRTLALGATGGSLLHRIARLLNRSSESKGSSGAVASILVAIVLATSIALASYRASRVDGQVKAPETQSTSAPASQPAVGILNLPTGPLGLPSSDAFTLEQRPWLSRERDATPPPIIYLLPLNQHPFATKGKEFIIVDTFRDGNLRPDIVTGDRRTRFADNDQVIFNATVTLGAQVSPPLTKVGSGTLRPNPATAPATQTTPSTAPSSSDWPTPAFLKSIALQLKLNNQAMHQHYGTEHPIMRESNRQMLHVDEYLANLSTIAVGRQDDAFESRQQVSELKSILLQFFDREHGLAAFLPADRRSQQIRAQLSAIRQAYLGKKKRLAETLPAAEYEKLCARFAAVEAVVVNGAKAPPISFDLTDEKDDVRGENVGLRLDYAAAIVPDKNPRPNELNVVWGGTVTNASLSLPAKSFRIDDADHLVFVDPLPPGSSGNQHYGALGSEIQWLQSLKQLLQRNQGTGTPWEREIAQQIIALERQRDEIGSYMQTNAAVPVSLTAAIESSLLHVEKRFAGVASSTTSPPRK